MSALQELTEASEQRAESEERLAAAFVAARAAGHSWAEVARAAGVSKSGARWLTRRAHGEIDGKGRTILEEER